jgi:hypothetical protein
LFPRKIHAGVVNISARPQNTCRIANRDHVAGDTPGDNTGGANNTIVSDVLHDNSVCTQPTIAANIDHGESLKLILDATARVLKTMLIFTAKQMDVVAEHGIVANGCKSDPGVGAKVDTMSYDGAGLSETGAKDEAAVQWTSLQGHPVVGVAKVAAKLARDQTEKLTVRLKPDIPAEYATNYAF